MAEPAFVLYLGGSTYVAPDGKVMHAVPEGCAVYPLPGDVSLDPSLVAAAMKAFADPDVALEHQLEEWVAAGQDDSAAAALFKLTEVATIIGGVLLSVSQPVPLVLAVISGVVVSAFGNGASDSDTAVALRNLRLQLQGEAQIARADVLLGFRAEIQGRLEALRARFSDLATHAPTGAARLALFEEMRRVVDEVAVPVARVRDEDWKSVFNPDDYKSRFGLSPVLVRVRPGGGLEPISPQPSLTQFDHRFGVPMLLYAATAYALMIRLAVPWFRSDGTFRDQLRALAAALDAFVVQMQASSLARTEHTAQSLFSHDVFPSSLYFGSPFGMLQPWGLADRFPVGAFDLDRYTDGYVVDRYASSSGTAEPGAIASFDYTWVPPASVLDPVGRVTDLDGAATAANEQARSDYARLLVASGAVHLLLTSALLRHLAAPPTSSETVTGVTRSARTLVGESPTTATSPVIFPNVTVSAAAALRRYEATARVRFATQPPGHRPAVRYRVLLRTIDSRFGEHAWREAGYLGRVWSSELEPIASDPRNRRLRTDFAEGLVLSQVELAAADTSPGAPLPLSGRGVVLQAHTHDWYVPVTQPRGTSVVSDLTDTLVRPGSPTPGARSVHLTDALRLRPEGVAATVRPLTTRTYTRRTRGALASPAEAIEETSAAVGAMREIDLADAERRHVRLEEVTLDWDLHWEDGRLEVRLTGRPGDRSFQAYVVVEEAVQSGEADGQVRWLHTPVAAEVVNQVTLVPQSFFADEARALETGRRLWEDIERRFSEVAEVGPQDPVARAVLRARELLTESTSTETLVTAMRVRLDAVREHHPELWADVARQHL